MPRHASVGTKGHSTKDNTLKLRSPVEVQVYLEKLTMMEHVGMNPYKVVKMWKNCRPYVPPDYHDNVLYAEPMAAQ